MSERSGGSYTYDPVTGTWTHNIESSSSSSDNSSSDSSSSSGSDNNLTSSTSDGDSSTGEVEKEYNTIELNTLVGTLNFIATKETIKLRAGDTVKLNGLGKYLSGNYYVKDITRQINNSGYSHSATLIKTNFGKSLKMNTYVELKPTDGSTPTITAKKEETSVESPAQSSNTPSVTHTVKAGECLWGLAVKYYNDGNKYLKIYEANKDKIKSDYVIYIGQVLVIP